MVRLLWLLPTRRPGALWIPTLAAGASTFAPGSGVSLAVLEPFHSVRECPSSTRSMCYQIISKPQVIVKCSKMLHVQLSCSNSLAPTESQMSSGEPPASTLYLCIHICGKKMYVKNRKDMYINLQTGWMIVSKNGTLCHTGTCSRSQWCTTSLPYTSYVLLIQVEGSCQIVQRTSAHKQFPGIAVPESVFSQP